MAINFAPYEYPVILFFLLPLLSIFWLIKKTIFSIDPTLPPGPNPWPIIGNLHELRPSPHVALAQIAKAHCPLISLRLGTQLLVVGSSPGTAMEILKTHDHVLSGRHVPHASYASDPRKNHMSIGYTFECTEKWKFLRALTKTELLSTKMIENQSFLREKQVQALVNFLRSREGKEIKIVDVVFASAFNFLGSVFFSKELVSFEEVEKGGGLGDLIKELTELWAALNISDMYPILSGLDLQGFRKKSNDCIQKVFSSWSHIIAERREGESRDASTKDFLDVLLENGFTDDQMNYLFLELLAGGSDPGTIAVEWAMAELLRNQNVLKTIRAELQREIPTTMVKHSDLPRLVYLQAVVKETLRLHPPAPLLLPHRSTEKCQVSNFTIPKGTQVLENVWAIGRDPDIWKNPLNFVPERFLDRGSYVKGNDFEFFPFGGGRRICPGMYMGINQIELTLANLVHCFEWSLPDGMVSNELDLDETFGVTLHKEKPLVVKLKYRTYLSFSRFCICSSDCFDFGGFVSA